MGKHSFMYMAMRVFVPFAFGYFLSYLYRVINAVIAPNLVNDLNLGPDVLGFLTASYFLAFAVFQLPLGVLLDRFGPRNVEAFLLIFAAIGAVCFALSENATSLIISRALIGFGVSSCLMASFKAFTVFYDASRLPLVNGFIMAAGGLGALAGTSPTAWVVEQYGWRYGFIGLGALTLLCAIIIFILVPKTPRPAHKTTFTEQLSGIKEIFTSRFFWRIAPITMMTQASFISVQSLWIGPWQRDVAGLPQEDVANNLFWLAATMVAGFLSIGTISERLGHKGISTTKVAGVGIFLFILFQVAILSDLVLSLPTLWFGFSFFGTTGIVLYAVLSQHFAKHLGGRVNTAINLLVFISTFCLQTISGQIINLWQTTASGGYQPVAYKAAFGLFLALQICAYLWFIKGALQKDQNR